MEDAQKSLLCVVGVGAGPDIVWQNPITTRRIFFAATEWAAGNESWEAYGENNENFVIGMGCGK